MDQNDFPTLAAAEVWANQPVMAAFDQGSLKPVIAVVNKATVEFGFDKMIPALQHYVDQFVAPAWGMSCTLTVEKDFVDGAWGFLFTDTADVAGALGYHDLTPGGFPLLHVFVKTTLGDGEKVPVTGSHELVESLIDPGINLTVQSPFTGNFVAYEGADACEALSFDVDGIPMSDFVLPAYFETFRKPGSDKFDHMGQIKQPLQILKGGYMPVWSSGLGWHQIFGSMEARNAFAAKDSRLHRSWRRGAKTVYNEVGEVC